jgi:hypothetical protein
MKDRYILYVCFTAIAITLIVEGSKFVALFILLHAGGVPAQ